MIWITTDTHFNHPKILEYEERPNNYQELIIKNWKKYISKDDIIIHLWDVIFDRQSELTNILQDLPWYKVLRWNHDKNTIEWYINKWFNFVCDRFDFKFRNKNIIFTHIPILVEWDNTYNIHWHLHTKSHHLDIQKWLSIDKNILISIENLKYKPIRLDILINNFK